MKPQLAKSIYKDCKDRGYVEHEGVLYPPAQAAALNLNQPKKKKRVITLKTGWIDDERNIKNKAAQKDMFMMLMQKDLSLDVWPEFFFTVERLYRLDYAIPEYKIGVEVDGGTWSKEKSGHSSGTGLARDREKSSLLSSLGWSLIRVEPKELISDYTINLIKSTIENKKNNQKY